MCPPSIWKNRHSVVTSSRVNSEEDLTITFRNAPHSHLAITQRPGSGRKGIQIPAMPRAWRRSGLRANEGLLVLVQGESCLLLSPEKYLIANALHVQLNAQGFRSRAQPSPYTSRRFSFVRRQTPCLPSGDLVDVALVLPEPEESRINGRPPAGLFPRHSTESWHE